MNKSQSVVAGNVYDKYRTRNPIARQLMRGFLTAAEDLMREVPLPEVPVPRVLEVGCGPGDLADALFRHTPRTDYVGTDLSTGEVATARRRHPRFQFLPASAYELPFPSRSFDLVVVCEVLEHLDRPAEALDEIARVCSGAVLASVPWEPAWRVLNLLRGAYLRDLGNTPGHLQHFSRGGFRDLLDRRFLRIGERRPFPWTMVLARPRPAPQ